MADPRSTAPPTVPLARVRRARLLRRVFFAVICLILLAAVLGGLGVHTRTATASGGGYELSVTFDDITRSGLPGNMGIEIRRTGGGPWPPTIDVSMTSSYGDILDTNATDPEPVESYTTGERTVQRFSTPPAGDTMTVSVDARVQPGVQWHRARGEVAILDDAGRDAVTVKISTFVMP